MSYPVTPMLSVEAVQFRVSSTPRFPSQRYETVRLVGVVGGSASDDGEPVVVGSACGATGLAGAACASGIAMIASPVATTAASAAKESGLLNMRAPRGCGLVPEK